MSDHPFIDRDPIEIYMDKRVEKMTKWELISYLKNAFAALYGVELIAEGTAEPAIFGWLKKTYGDVDAGRIVKYVIWAYFGRDSANPGSYVRFTSFCKARKWWIDAIHNEMQQQVMRETTPVVQAATTSVWL